MADTKDNNRVVITGVGLASPNGSNLSEFRKSLLEGKSGVEFIDTHYMEPVLAGVCHFDALRYQTRKSLRRGTRAGSIAIYCSREAMLDAGIEIEKEDTSKIGVYLGITEHGNVETEHEIYNLKDFNYDIKVWSHHHNPRTVANNPAGEVTLNMRITGPHYTLGAACAAGNVGIIHGMQMLQLGDVGIAIAGGVSESIHTFGTFASFKNEGALASHNNPAKASRPFDKARNGVVVAEGGAVYVLEKLPTALNRGAKIYGEIVGYAINSDASDFIMPSSERQAECMQLALKKAAIKPEHIDIISSHATSTLQGDIKECIAIRETFSDVSSVYINNTKSFIGHAMGAAGALELAGNLPSFQDKIVHPTINVDDIDPDCELRNLVINTCQKVEKVNYILNNSFGMLGINAVLIIKRFEGD